MHHLSKFFINIIDIKFKIDFDCIIKRKKIDYSTFIEQSNIIKNFQIQKIFEY